MSDVTNRPRTDGPAGTTRTDLPPPTTEPAVPMAGPVVDDGTSRMATPTTIVRESPTVVADPGDRVRWGPIWAGVVVVIAVFALLQLALFATDAISLDINPTSSDESFTLWTALAAIVAFLIGGMVAGATAKWRNLTDGLIQGIVMWSVAVIALLIASSIALGNLTSSLGGVLGRLADLRSSLAAGESADSAAVDDARTVAAQACLFLGLTVVAAGVGALVGAKLWPRRTHDEMVDDRVTTRTARSF